MPRKSYCSIFTCENFRGSTDVTVFRTPNDLEMRNRWREIILKHQKVDLHFRLCQLHFETKYWKEVFQGGAKCGRLKPEAIPTIFKTAPEVKIEPEETPVPPSCTRCIKYSVQAIEHKLEIEQLQKTCQEKQHMINKLQEELDKCNAKLQQIQSSGAESCSFCGEKYIENNNHICNGQKTIGCEYCIDEFTSISELVQHLKVTHRNKTFHSCSECQECFAMTLLLEFHKKSHAILQPIIICDICHMHCSSDEEFDKHMKQKHTIRGSLQSGDIKFFKCGTCSEAFTDVLGLKDHVRSIHENFPTEQFECYLCKLHLKSKSDLTNHMTRHNRRNSCAVCLKKCTLIELENHICSELTDLTCSYCKKTFNSTKKLLNHLKNSCKSEKIIYKCTSCPSSFAIKTIFDYHMQQHKGEQKPYVCDICSKSFSKRLYLQNHRAIHNATRSHLCEECGKGFMTLAYLRSHKRSHDKGRHFECPECHKLFTSKPIMSRHLETHQNTLYNCNICDKKLSTSYGLSSHMALHKRTESDRKHDCSLCPKKFFELDHLKRHLKYTHSSEKLFECDICQLKYKYSGDLGKHKRVMHP